MKAVLIGASHVKYNKAGEDKEFRVLRCLLPIKQYPNSKSENLGFEQKELFVNAEIYDIAKAFDRFPVDVDITSHVDPFKKKTYVKGLKALNEKAA